MTPAVEVESLTYRYPLGPADGALRGVSFSIAPGESVAIIGANGAGKSTLLLHLNGLLPDGAAPGAAGGRVRIGGELVTRESLRRVRRAVGLLFQDPDDQLFCPTVFDDAAFGPRQFGMKGAPLDSVVGSALAAVGLSGLEQRSPDQLSFGEKRRACLAGVLACDPSVLVLDEPTSGLDPRGRRELIALLKGLPATRVIATHDLDAAAALCSRCIVLDRGAVAVDGPSERILADAALLQAHGL